MSKVLFNRKPITIDIDFATAVGLNEAIVLQQIHYWIVKNKEEGRNLKEGRFWTYNSIEEWHKKIPFLKKDAVRKSLEKLRKLEILLVGNYNKSRVDRTLWYTINYEKLDEFMQVVEAQSIKELISKDDGEPQMQSGDNTNAFVKNHKCKDEKNANANVENHTPIPNIYTNKYLGMYVDPFECYEQNFCKLIPAHVRNMIISFIEDGISQELICYIICETVSKQKTWNYAAGILNDCVANMCYTIDQFKIKNLEFRASLKGGKKNASNDSRPSRKSISTESIKGQDENTAAQTILEERGCTAEELKARASRHTNF